MQVFPAVLPGNPSQHPPGLVARLVEPAGRNLLARLLGGALLLAVAGAASWLLTPGSMAQRFPGEDALGTPAVGSFRAARDYEILDAAATAHLQEVAVSVEPPVYDDDAEAAGEAALRVRSAFISIRHAQAQGRRAGERSRPAPPPPGLASAREAFEDRLGVPLQDPDFAALVEARFADPVEQRLEALAVRALTGPVVDDRERLLADADQGIVARPVRGGGERLVRDMAPIRDLRVVREALRSAAGDLPAAWSPALREAVLHIAAQLARPTLSYNLAETARRQREARARVKPVVIQVKRGERILADGERIERRHLVILAGIQAQTRDRDLRGVRVGGGLLIGLLLLLLWPQAWRGARGVRPSTRDAAVLALVFLGTLGVAAAGLAAGDALHDLLPWLTPETIYHLVPFAAGAMMIRALLGRETALRFAVASGIAVGLLAGHSLFFAMHAVLTALAASGLVRLSRDRVGLVEAGVAVGLLGAALAVASQLFTGRGVSEAMAPAAAAFLGGALLLPALVGLLLPIAERWLGYVTEARLLELANLNHPALKDLIVQAPGTYHHSVILGALVEAAAEPAGANALLARVCALFHDLGKLRNPLYFAENQRAENRHEQLAPSMSALIVKRHVTDGVELARRWKLPPQVVDAIAQHHGTRFVSWFWAKARKAAEEGKGPWEDAASVDEALFRYAGPRPRSREAALVMLADVAEASARGLSDPTPERLVQVVNERVDELVAEGQLDECPLTLRQLRGAAQAMGRALEVVYRARGDDTARPQAQPDDPDRLGLHLVAKS